MTANALLAIYDTVTQPDRWKSTLDTVARSIGAIGGGLYVRRFGDRPYDFLSMSSTYDRVGMEEYMAKYAHLEAPQWQYLGRQPPLRLVLDDQAGVPREILDARADYVVNREQAGVQRRVAFRMNDIPAWYDAAIFGFGLEHDDIPRASLQALRPLLPHLAKAVEVGRSFTLLRARYRAALAVLDHILVGIAIALPSGEFIVHNAEAARILDAADGVALGRNRRLLLANPGQQEAVEAAIRLAGRTLGGEAGRAATLARLPRRSGSHPYLLEVTPLADTGGELDRSLAGALVMLVDPDHVPPDSIRRAATVYDLTPAESGVLELLIGGSSGPEITERRGTAPETVKSQIAAVMAKTGARNRGDLIRRILRVMPPVA